MSSLPKTANAQAVWHEDEASDRCGLVVELSPDANR